MFLTYSNPVQQMFQEPGSLPFTKEMLMEYIKAKGNVSYVVVSLEYHVDGNVHFHAMVLGDGKFDFKDCHKYDYLGCHPKIEPVRQVKASMDYVKKDGDWCCWGVEPINRSGRLTQLTADEILDLARSMKRPLFLAHMSARNRSYAPAIWDSVHGEDFATINQVIKKVKINNWYR
jgi:hypothetical protein